MNTKAILILGPAELAGLLREYPDKLFLNDCIALTPDAYEYSKTDLRFQNLSYPKWVQAIRSFSIEDYQTIEENLISLEGDSCRMRAQLSLDHTSQVDWNYQSNFSIASMLASARSFASQAFPHLAHYQDIEILSLGHAGEFYFDSCIQSAVLCHELQKLAGNVRLIILDERTKAITYQPQLYETLPNLFSNKFITEWHSVKKSVLVATSALYSKDDQQKLTLVIKGAYSDSHSISYPLPLWSVINASNLFSERCTIYQALELLSDEDRSNCLIYSEWLTAATESRLLEIFGDPNFKGNPLFQAQMNRLHKRHILQTLTYIGWCITFGNHKTQMLAISIQDSTINGPLASAAKMFGVEVVVFPHSHIVNWRTPCECTVATEWWQPVSTSTLWGKQNRCIYFDTQVYSVEKRSYLNRASNWMILYNGVQENLQNSVAWPFIQQVVNLIVNRAYESRANLIHRLKPGDQTPTKTFCELLGLDITSVSKTLAAPLKDLLMETDLVVSADDPSSALWEAMSLGCAVVLVTDRKLTREAIVDGDILRPIDFKSFEDLIFSFVKNPMALEEYRFQQQQSFLKLRSERIGR